VSNQLSGRCLCGRWRFFYCHGRTGGGVLAPLVKAAAGTAGPPASALCFPSERNAYAVGPMEAINQVQVHPPWQVCTVLRAPCGSTMTWKGKAHYREFQFHNRPTFYPTRRLAAQTRRTVFFPYARFSVGPIPEPNIAPGLSASALKPIFPIVETSLSPPCHVRAMQAVRGKLPSSNSTKRRPLGCLVPVRLPGGEI